MLKVISEIFALGAIANIILLFVDIELMGGTSWTKWYFIVVAFGIACIFCRMVDFILYDKEL